MIAGEKILGLGCPECEAKTKVIDSRNSRVETSKGYEDVIRRRRKCLACSNTFTTFEIAATSKGEAFLKGYREKFEREIDRLQSTINFLKTLIQE